MSKRNRTNLINSGANTFATSHRDGESDASLQAILEASHIAILRYFESIRQDSFIQNDDKRSKKLIPEREVTVIRGNIPRGVYRLCKVLTEKAEAMIHTHFNGDLYHAIEWINE